MWMTSRAAGTVARRREAFIRRMSEERLGARPLEAPAHAEHGLAVAGTSSTPSCIVPVK